MVLQAQIAKDHLTGYKRILLSWHVAMNDCIFIGHFSKIMFFFLSLDLLFLWLLAGWPSSLLRIIHRCTHPHLIPGNLTNKSCVNNTVEKLQPKETWQKLKHKRSKKEMEKRNHNR